jgi:signal transduction histidine kinase
MSATEDDMGYYWMMHRGGTLTRIYPETDHFQTFVYGKGQLAFPGASESINDAFMVSHQNKNGIWFQTHESVSGNSSFIYYDFTAQNFSFFNNNFNFQDNELPTNRIIPFNFMKDQTGLLWLYTRPGMYKQSPKKRQMELYRHSFNDYGSLPSDTINYLFEDSKNRLWVGTRRGLALYQPETDDFWIFRQDPENASTISHSNITAIIEDEDGKIWIGTENGLNQWQESTGHFRRFFFSPKETNNCAVLFADKQHRLWLSVLNKGVFLLEKTTGMILKSYLPDLNNPAALTSKEISTIYQDYNGNIWLGTNSRTNSRGGLFRLNSAEDGFFHYLPNPEDSTSISDRIISFIAGDGKKRLWIGANQGLNLYDPANDCFKVFYNNTITSLTSFSFDKSGEPWVGTYSGGGLVSIDLQNEIITDYDETKGLLHNDLSQGRNKRIATDNFGRFWLPNQRGLSVFDPETRSFVSYFEKDGFQPYSRTYTSIKTTNGDIWIGGRNGLNRIIPSELLKKDTTLPSVVITQVKILDSLYSIPDGKIFNKSVAHSNDFQVKYWQKDIGFDFVALHYLRPEDNLYSWKLENYDKDWSVPSKERKASYTNLSPGDYVFRVRASNADGVWNEEGVSIAMTILPPWWKTWWAYIAYVLMFLIALRSYTIWRERNLRKEKEHLQVKVEERTTELKKSIEEIKSAQTQLIHSEKMASLGALTAGIAHEIQNPLNFVNNFSEVNKELIDELKQELTAGSAELAYEIADNIKENEDKISHHGKRAESIVRGMLLHSRGSSGHKEPVYINALCDEYLRLSYHGFRAKDKAFNADYKTNFDPNLPKINVVPQDIGRVLLNLINNAFYAVDKRAKESTSMPPEGGAKNAQTDFRPLVIITTTSLKSPSADGDSRLNDAVGQVGVEIRVKDNGPGIPEEIIDKIFQPFFTTKPTGQGTGLGLSLAYDIVKAHGGELRVETKDWEANQDKPALRAEGTEFIIKLPVN